MPHHRSIRIRVAFNMDLPNQQPTNNQRFGEVTTCQGSLLTPHSSHDHTTPHQMLLSTDTTPTTHCHTPHAHATGHTRNSRCVMMRRRSMICPSGAHRTEELSYSSIPWRPSASNCVRRRTKAYLRTMVTTPWRVIGSCRVMQPQATQRGGGWQPTRTACG